MDNLFTKYEVLISFTLFEGTKEDPKLTNTVAVWHSGNGVGRINKVTLC